MKDTHDTQTHTQRRGRKKERERERAGGRGRGGGGGGGGLNWRRKNELALKLVASIAKLYFTIYSVYSRK